MSRIINFLALLIVILFFYKTIKYYFSERNIQSINLNRTNIENIMEDKISKLDVLNNNTNNVIEFNSSFSNTTNIDKPRSFWDLLKIK